MSMVTPRFFSPLVGTIVMCTVLLFSGSASLLNAEEDRQAQSTPKTKTIIADMLEVEGDFHIVRGAQGEIRIEVTPDTNVSEEFIYGDRIKAIVLPNDVAQSITRAAPDEPIGITTNEPSVRPLAPTPTPIATSSTSEEELATSPLYEAYQVPKVRVIVADILMVDGTFYIIRNEFGEIQIEITSETELSEEFKFGDRIKARVTPADKALTVTRAGKDEPVGILKEDTTQSTPATPAAPPNQTTTPAPAATESSEPLNLKAPAIRIIVADVLMVDGDLFIVRGERGEIQIEVTPKTTVSESFDYGDRIKAEVLPNDKALTIERAGPNDPIGITTP